MPLSRKRPRHAPQTRTFLLLRRGLPIVAKRRLVGEAGGWGVVREGAGAGRGRGGRGRGARARAPFACFREAPFACEVRVRRASSCPAPNGSSKVSAVGEKRRAGCLTAAAGPHRFSLRARPEAAPLAPSSLRLTAAASATASDVGLRSGGVGKSIGAGFRVVAGGVAGVGGCEDARRRGG